MEKYKEVKGKILVKISTHKAVIQEGENEISIVLRGIDFRDIVKDDEVLYKIGREREDDVFAIMERYEEDNRINFEEFKKMML